MTPPAGGAEGRSAVQMLLKLVQGGGGKGRAGPAAGAAAEADAEELGEDPGDSVGTARGRHDRRLVFICLCLEGPYLVLPISNTDRREMSKLRQEEAGHAAAGMAADCDLQRPVRSRPAATARRRQNCAVQPTAGRYPDAYHPSLL